MSDLSARLRCLASLLQQLNAKEACAAVNDAIAALTRSEVPAGWVDASKEQPPEDVPVWCLTQGDGIFIGGYCYVGDGWAWTNCYSSIYHTLKDGRWKWEANDFEYDDDYQVIAWQHLPSPPTDSRGAE